MTINYHPGQNQLLNALSSKAHDRILPALKLVELPKARVLCEPGTPQAYAYFPTDAIIAVLFQLTDGTTVEVAMVGFDGMLGIPLLMGGASAVSRDVVQSPGHAFRLPAEVLKAAFFDSMEIQRLMLRYAQVMITQMAQAAVCNRHHSVEQQVCRCLLMSMDRLRSNDLKMTHELIAGMLGVRREGVTGAAVQLQKRGIISYRRGHINVHDRARLEQASCECYQVVRLESKRLMMHCN